MICHTDSAIVIACMIYYYDHFFCIFHSVFFWVMELEFQKGLEPSEWLVIHLNEKGKEIEQVYYFCY